VKIDNIEQRRLTHMCQVLVGWAGCSDAFIDDWRRRVMSGCDHYVLIDGSSFNIRFGVKYFIE
jgi:hypothetical protein